MTKSTWRDVEKGDRVEVKGREYTVAKVKLKGKVARVRLTGAGSSFDGEVKAKDPVKIKREPLHGKDGAMTRWAKDSETVRPMPGGDPDLTKPPAKPGPDPWETRRDRVERVLDDLLSAHLVGEATDEDAGYYCPPVDITTVAAHLALFHGIDPSSEPEGTWLMLHNDAHAAAGAQPFKVNHWHTKTRPAAA